MLVPCIASLYTITNAVHWVISFILICRLLHVSAHVCHPQGAFYVLASYIKQPCSVSYDVDCAVCVPFAAFPVGWHTCYETCVSVHIRINYITQCTALVIV